MSERLTELQRQRALIQNHLSWLDREIAAAQGLPIPPQASPIPNATPALSHITAPITAPTAKALETTDEVEAERIIGRFQQDPNTLKTDTRRGCLTAFALALGLMALVTFIAYWLYARHLGRWW